MLKRGVSFPHRSLRAIELTLLIFDDYTNSIRFSADASEIINVLIRCVLFNQEYRPGMLCSELLRNIWRKALYRFTECAIAALCVNGPVFCQDAVSFYYFYPVVREYFIEQCWVTRLAAKVSSWLYPRILFKFFQRTIEPWLPFTLSANTTKTTQSSSSSSSSLFSSSKKFNNVKTDKLTNTSASARSYNSASSQINRSSRQHAASTINKSEPKNMEEAFAKVPVFARDALRFYRYYYDINLPYAVCAAGFIPDMAEILFDNLLLLSFAIKERHKPSFPSRVIRVYVSYLCNIITKNTTAYIIRFIGAWLGRCFASHSVGKSIFWSEHLIYSFSSPLVGIGVILSMKYSNDLMKYIYPLSAEEIIENELDEAEAIRQFVEANPEREVINPDAAKIDHYAVLGVTEQATTDEIKKAYRKLALSNHPDRAGSSENEQAEARERMASINNAYNTLSNDENRIQYDALRHNNYFDVTMMTRKLSRYSTGQLTAMIAGIGCGIWILVGSLLNIQVQNTLNRFTQIGSIIVIPVISTN